MIVAPRRKLIEVSLPLEAINRAAAREKSIRHGHPSTLHLWWARRPLAACRAVLFAQLVDDPSAWPERFPGPAAQDAERRRLHRLIEDMVAWEASNDDRILDAARFEIARSVAWGLGEEPPAKGDGKAVLAYLQAKAPPVHDPFSGGGSIPLEAQRLGLRAHGSDLNPVAVLIGKALVEIPPIFAGRAPVNPAAQAQLGRGGLWNGRGGVWNGRGGVWNGRGACGLAEDVRHYGGWMRDEAARRIGHLYPQAVLADGAQATIVAWLWARTVRSPDPAAKGAMVPLVSSFLLSSKNERKVWVEPVIEAPAPHGWRFQVKAGPLTQADEARLKRGTKGSGRGSNFTCVLTGATIHGTYIKAEGMAGRLGARLMAVVADARRRRIYLEPDGLQQSAAEAAEADPCVREARQGALHSPVPSRLTGGTCYPYGLTSFGTLFTSRQVVALTTFCDLVAEARRRALADARAAGLPEDDVPLHAGGTGAEAYADAVATYLGLGVSRLADAQNALCQWGPAAGQTQHLFRRQAIPMIWDFAESNVFSHAAGDLATSLHSMCRALARLPASGSAAIHWHDAASTRLPLPAAVISTDPPYYDNIAYADLSDFFYVWLKRALTKTWPQLFRRLTTPKDQELVATPFRHGGREAAQAFFMQGMGEALAAMRRAASDGAPLTIYYAFKQSQAGEDGVTSAGWASFLQAIVDAGLTVDGTWPVRTERGARSVGIGANALASSIVLVCRKRPADAGIIGRADFVAALKRELPPAIEAIRKAGVGPVDMQQAIIGPGMGVFTRHAEVLEDDDRVIPVKTALAIINRAWEEIDDELVAAFDAETQVALAWFGSYGFEAQASGELITLATAKNTSDRALFATGVFRNLHGKASLTRRRDLPRNWLPSPDKGFTVWEAVQHLVRALHAEDGGAAAAAALLARMGAKAEAARAEAARAEAARVEAARVEAARTLADRLFRLATDRGWAQEALAYNHLAEEWPDLLDRAAAIGQGRHQAEAGDLFAPAVP